MWLARTILQQNTDPAFVDSLIKNPSIKKNSELVELLKQGRDIWFSNELLKYMFDGHENIIKKALQITYHPVMIDMLRNYTKQQWITQRDIDKQAFIDPDMFRDFFAIYKNINLDDSDVESIIQEGFDDDTMVVGSSHVVYDRDDLYLHFSAVRKVKTMESWLIQFHYVKKNFAWGFWEWLDNVSLYLKQRFPEEGLFSILKLNPDDIL